MKNSGSYILIGIVLALLAFATLAFLWGKLILAVTFLAAVVYFALLIPEVLQ